MIMIKHFVILNILAEIGARMDLQSNSNANQFNIQCHGATPQKIYTTTNVLRRGHMSSTAAALVLFIFSLVRPLSAHAHPSAMGHQIFAGIL